MPTSVRFRSAARRGSLLQKGFSCRVLAPRSSSRYQRAYPESTQRRRMLNENRGVIERKRHARPRRLAAILTTLAIVSLVNATASPAQVNLDRFNGFESGGAGDYEIGAGAPTADPDAHTGMFGLLTAADAGTN